MTSNISYNASLSVTEPLRKLIHSGATQYTYHILEGEMSGTAEVHQQTRKQVTMNANHLREELPPTLQRAMDLAHVKSSSNWLITMSLEEHGFSLHKGAFLGASRGLEVWVDAF